MPHTDEIPAGIRDDVARLVAYNWASEVTDFARPDVDGSNHILHSLVRLRLSLEGDAFRNSAEYREVQELISRKTKERA